MQSLQEIFPNASQSTLEANPQPIPQHSQKTQPGATSTRRRGIMNKTELEFAMFLEVMKEKGEILRYEYEGITFRWADMRYTPDFIITKVIPVDCESCGKRQTIMLTYHRLIEVKGAHIWDRDIVRFKGARAYWPEFAFEMYQKTRDGWKRKF